MPWLLVVSGQEQGSSYASGMKEAARLKSSHSVASSWFSSVRKYFVDEEKKEHFYTE
jgi:hypothetical protein